MNWLNLPDAIAHKWGYVADTIAIDPETAWITAWRHLTLPEPTVEELADAIAEYEARILITPDWGQFRAQILIHGAYLRIVTSHPIAQALNSALVWLLGEVSSNPDILPDFANTWNGIAAIAFPTAEEIGQLNALAAACHAPFGLNEQGLMVLV